MSELPSLADILAAHQPDDDGFTCTGCPWTPPNPSVTGSEDFGAHQSAMWYEACTITTVDQLDALPPETVIKTQGGSIACRHYSGVGVVFGDDRPFSWTSSLSSELPGVVLWHPDWSAS